MSNIFRTFVFLTVIIGVAYLSRQSFRHTQARHFLNQLKELSVGAHEATDSDPLMSGTKARDQLFEVRAAYDRVQLHNTNDETLKSLFVLANGLVAENEIVRETTGDIVRHILTEYLLSGGARSPVVDEFFKFYKKSGSRSLAEFLKTFPDGREAQYLGAI